MYIFNSNDNVVLSVDIYSDGARLFRLPELILETCPEH